MAASALFCTSCGHRAGSQPVARTQEQPRQVAPTPVRVEDFSESETTSLGKAQREEARSFARSAMVGLGISFVFLALGVGLTATGATEFIIGNRYTESELDNAVRTAVKVASEDAKEKGYEAGYDAGQSVGYRSGVDDGKSDGFRTGFDDGCNHVFDEIGENLIAIRAPWYESSVYGGYWPRNDVC